MIESIFLICLLGIGGIIWLYIVARFITGAVLRTIEERKHNGKKR